MKITVIDDDKILSNLIKEAIEYRGNHDVTVFNRAADAITNLNELLASDVVLLDLMMRRPETLPVGIGEETGEALLRLIKKSNIRLPVIIITGKEVKDISANIRNQSIDVLMKPLDPKFNDLLEAIHNAK